MTFLQTWMALPVALCVALLFVLISVSWRLPQKPGGRAYQVLLMVIVGWLLANLGEKAAETVSGKLFFANTQYLFAALSSLCWYVFACLYTRRYKWVTPTIVRILAIGPTLIAIAAFSDSWLHGMRRSVSMQMNDMGWLGSFPVLHVEYGPLFYAMAFYCYILCVVAMSMLAVFAIQGPPHFRLRLILLVTTGVFPVIFNITYVFGVRPLGDIDLSPFGLAVGSMLGAWILVHQRALDLAPVARNIIFQAVPDPVIVLDDIDRVVDVNLSAERLQSPVPLRVGNALSDVLPSLAAHLNQVGALPAADDLTDTPQPPLNLVWGGRQRKFEVRVSRIQESSHYFGRLLQLIDITDRLEIEEHRDRLVQAMHRSQTLESLGYLAGTVAHDFNDLLVGIMGNAALARDEAEPNSMIRRLADYILLAAENAADLTQQLQAYSGQRLTTMHPISLVPLLSESVDFLRWTLKRNIKLDLDCEGGLPWIQGDSGQLTQMLTHLVTNASDAIGSREGRITIKARQVNLAKNDVRQLIYSGEMDFGNYIILEIQDNGCGMSTETLARIFEPFFSTKNDGRGLGLAAVLGVMRAHKGGINVESSPGAGTTFRLYLPASPMPSGSNVTTVVEGIYSAPTVVTQIPAVDCDVAHPSVE